MKRYLTVSGAVLGQGAALLRMRRVFAPGARKGHA
jgi:hypothetical protein